MPRLGVNQQVIIFPEVTYGTVPTQYEATMEAYTDIQASYEPGIEAITKEVYAGELQAQSCETKRGREMPTASLSGEVTKEKLPFLLKGIFGDTTKTSPFFPTTQDSAKYSYTMMFIDTESETATILAGVVFGNLSITNSSSQVLTNFTADVRCKSITNNVDISSWTGTAPVASCGTSIRFGDITATINPGNITALKSYTLNITNEFVDDDNLFMNADAKALDIIKNQTATFECETYYEGDAYQDDVIDGSSKDITITNSTAGVDIYLSGHYMSPSIPTVGKGLFMTSRSYNLAKFSTFPSITIGIS